MEKKAPVLQSLVTSLDDKNQDMEGIKTFHSTEKQK